MIDKQTNDDYSEDDGASDVREAGGGIRQYSIPLAIVVAGIVIGVAIMASGGVGSGPTAAVAPSEPHRAGSLLSVDVDDDPMLGDADAPVTIIEFSDYQCPFCRQFWQETLPLIEENYIKTGVVRFVYRDFPLSSIHPDAQLAAEVAECAGDQGYYWQAHDAIFYEQTLLGRGTVRFSQDDIERWFSAIEGLDVGRVRACLASGEKEEEVLADVADGRAAGIGGTPGFIVNGRPIEGALPYEAFRQVIEAALADQR